MRQGDNSGRIDCHGNPCFELHFYSIPFIHDNPRDSNVTYIQPIDMTAETGVIAAGTCSQMTAVKFH